MSQRRIKVALFALCALAILATLDVGFQALDTLSRLTGIESERDRWQKPSDVIAALNLKPGDVVADLGCGSGYFTLKLPSSIGNNGRVLAEDIRRLPLAFLWFRAFQRGERNVKVVLGDEDDPHLPRKGVNEVLIFNTYHELADPQAILAHIRDALVAGGRLVVADREPHQTDQDGGISVEHEVSPDQVQSDLRKAGFEIVARQDRFIDRDPYNEQWWMISGREPQPSPN